MTTMAKILIVDDEKLIVEMLSTFLRVMGHDSIKTLSSTQARDVLADTRPDAILLDIMLPETNGLEFCRELRRQEGTASLPIIIISACAPPQTTEAARAGASLYVSKPVNVATLQNALASVGIASPGR
jgi:two-component system, OmpR family, phosphate regulon response regulator PhoB